DLAGRGYEHVVRREIAVDDQVVMGELYRPGDLPEHCQPRCRRPLLLGQPVIEGLAFDEFHYDIGLTVCGFPSSVETRDVWVVELREDLAFAYESVDQRLDQDPGLDDLDGDAMLETRALTLGQPYGAHTAAA